MLKVDELTAAAASLVAPAVPSYAHLEQGAPVEPPLLPDAPDFALHVPAVAVDKKDLDTPDNWVRRDPRILRLTGRHPLNCEPPMQALMESGFITPPSIHYVRNHGAVPHLEWATHRVEVGGLVDKPMSFSMDDILSLPSFTIPVTLTCAGNRRKEENMIKKSIGFNWGACATSCSYWTGVRLSDLLKLCGVKGRDAGARHVCFRGPLGELPKGSDGSYGTSVPLHKAMDPANDIMIAYKQNDRWLTPDHGFPVRLVLPGYIGGRMIKWLCEITVTSIESQNFYHFMDNRVLPSHVDEEMAKKEGWWYKPDFIINELNINSAVSSPWHDELLELKEDKPYTARGYAYTGGGRKVIRVEVSLDGETWKPADIQRFEEPTESGKLWCWVHWSLELRTWDFLRSPEMLVRAWDDSMNCQPAMIAWNLMGMMNNCYFRVKILPHTDTKGHMCLRFQHPAPVEIGTIGHIGWREEDNLKAQAMAGVSLQAAAPVASTSQPAGALSKGRYTMAQVAEHTTEKSAWFVHEGKVYDATEFLEEHPGGAESILISTGADATEEFNAIHSSKAKGMLATYYIGDLVEHDPAGPATPELPAATSFARVSLDSGTSTTTVSAPIALNPREKLRLRLAEKIEVSHNTRLFRFALPSPFHRLGLPVGKHVFVYGQTNGETFMRAYTPTSSDEDLGHLDLLIKVYFANEHPDFPDGGKMSQYLDALSVGDMVDVKGPVGHFVYEGRGAYTSGKIKGHARHLSMIAGGTGITPCYQVIKAVLRDAEDPTQMSLIFANRSQEDILLRDELDALAAEHPTRFKVWYTIDAKHAGDKWRYSVGRVNEDMLRAQLFPYSEGTLALMCGPPGLLNHAAVPNLEKMGYTKTSLVMF